MSRKSMDSGAMGSLRAAAILTGFTGLTVPLMPLQAGLVRFAPRLARRLPHWYHRRVCRLIGVRLDIEGTVVRDRPVLLVSNHTSWLDIPVLSALAPVSFVAKKEVGTWPGVAALARLQRTVFVDRQRRSAVGSTAGEIIDRLGAGDSIVLFAEGTSSDGNRVLPFRTSLFAAAKPSAAARPVNSDASEVVAHAVVQTISIVYTHLHGVPLGRADRPLIGWYGDMDLPPHAWELLKAGPLDVRIMVGPPVPLDAFADRKGLARHSEDEIRANVVRALRGL
ncbi:MAG TPA: lysophospholipid acyltransferase family protein, partial [Hyphomicrobiaceae bacterium]|nr:lysophospholipid acyltransferase family protein [Hyphomicrobiaceae bacterium]